MTVHELKLLGEPVWLAPDGPVALPGRKPAAMLWYLAAHPGVTITRSQLASLFWGYQSDTEAKANVTKNLSRLRLALPLWPVQQSRGTVTWQPAGGVRTDLQTFVALTDAGGLDACREAVALWRGPFLAGLELTDCPEFEHWLLGQREALERRLLQALAALAEAAVAARAWSELEAWCEQALAADRLQDRFHRWLMLALANRGDRNAALAHYNRYREMLYEELGVEPEPSTTALRDQLLAGASADATASTAAAAVPRQPAAPPAPAPSQPAGATHAPARRRAPSGPLIGRDRELARVLDVVHPAARGPLPIVFLHGDAGIGKTRLSEEVIQAWDASAGSVLIARCYKETSSLPYVPLANALMQAEQLGPGTSEPLPAAYVTALNQFLPALEQSGMPAGDGEGYATRQRQSPYEVGHGIARLLELLPAPVLLVVEDVHKADEDTLQVLVFLARRPPRQQLAILATGRKGALNVATMQLLRELERERCLVWHELGPLPAAAIGELAASLLGAADAALARSLHARSGGNPLFAIELVRAWQRTTAGARDRATRPDPVAIDALPLPETLQAVIASRFEGLSPQAEMLLATAAIFGQQVSLETLQHVADLRTEDALTALDELLQAEILSETAHGITFSHELLRQGAASRTSKARSQQLHRRAYHYLLTTWAQAAGVSPAEYHLQQLPWTTAYALGAHALAGGLWEEALSWNEAGANSCLRTFRMPIATQFRWRMLQSLVALPETPERRDRLTTLGLTLTSDFLMFAGNPWHPKPNDITFGAWDLTATSSRPPIHAAKTALLGDYETVRSLLEHMLDVLPEEATAQRAAAIRAYGAVLTQLGDLARGIRTLQQSAALDQQLGHHAEAGVTAFALSALLAEAGRFDEAEQVLSRVQQAAQSARDETLLATAQAFVALVALARRDWSALRAACTDAMALAAGIGFQYVNVFARLAYGPMLFSQGDLEAAIAAQRDTVSIVSEQERGRWLVLSYAWLAEILAAAGRPDEGAAAASAGWELANSRRNRYGRAQCARVRGLAAQATDPAAAAHWLQEALAEANAIGAVPLAQLCRDALAALHGQAERR